MLFEAQTWRKCLGRTILTSMASQVFLWKIDKHKHRELTCSGGTQIRYSMCLCWCDLLGYCGSPIDTVLDAKDNTYKRIDDVTCHRISIIDGRVLLQFHGGKEQYRSACEDFHEFLVHVGATEVRHKTSGPVSGATRLTERSKKRRENKINDKRKTRDASHRSKHYDCVYISSKHLGRKACGAMRDFYSV